MREAHAVVDAAHDQVRERLQRTPLTHQLGNGSMQENRSWTTACMLGCSHL
jgi:hypothetical protein